MLQGASVLWGRSWSGSALPPPPQSNLIKLHHVAFSTVSDYTVGTGLRSPNLRGSPCQHRGAALPHRGVLLALSKKVVAWLYEPGEGEDGMGQGPPHPHQMHVPRGAQGVLIWHFSMNGSFGLAREFHCQCVHFISHGLLVFSQSTNSMGAWVTFLELLLQ